MNTNKQTYEIIEDIRLFHNKMEDYYNQLHKKDEDQKVKMLLDYLIQHEKHRNETLAEYEKEASHKAMDAWFKYIPNNITYDRFKDNTNKSKMTVCDVVSIAMDFNSSLINMYKSLVNETEIDELKDIFNSLLRRLEQEQKNLVRDSLWLYDM